MARMYKILLTIRYLCLFISETCIPLLPQECQNFRSVNNLWIRDRDGKPASARCMALLTYIFSKDQEEFYLKPSSTKCGRGMLYNMHNFHYFEADSVHEANLLGP